MKILVLANSGSGLYKFTKELLIQLLALEYEVYISFPENEYAQKLQVLGCSYIRSVIDRRGTNPLKDIRLIFSYLKMLHEIKPAVVLTYTIKPNIYGGIACRITKTPYIANITGLGTSIENKGWIRKLSLMLYRIGLKKAACVFCVNESNRQLFIKEKIAPDKIKSLPGSGVNLEQYRLEEYPEDNGSIRFLFIGRIMKDKGIEELLEAAVKVKEQFPDSWFDIVGPCEEGYGQYLNELEELSRKGILHYYGLQEEVVSFIRSSHTVILPSYHEGTSNALLEAAACGRPLLASKVPGCMETFEDGISGIGFEIKNTDSLIEAIIKFIELPYEKKQQMGLAGRAKMEREYDRKLVISAYLQEINRIRVN